MASKRCDGYSFVDNYIERGLTQTASPGRAESLAAEIQPIQSISGRP